MVGNVTSVSLQETVGTPAPQAKAASAPGQNFAAVMQRAGNEAGTSLPAATSSVQGSQESEQDADQDVARSTSFVGGASAVQSDASKMDTPSALGLPGKPANKTSLGLQTNSQFAKWSGTGTVQNVLSSLPHAPLEKAGGIQANNGVTSSEVSAKENESVVAAQDVLVAEADSVDLAAVANIAGAANPAFQGNSEGAVTLQPVGVSKKSGKEPDSLETKPPSKPVDAKGDSKLTAVIPQGTAVVPQSDASVAGLNVVVPMIAVPVATGSIEKNVGNDLAAGVSGLLGTSGPKAVLQAMLSSQGVGDAASGVSLPGILTATASSTAVASPLAFEKGMAETVGTPGPATERAGALTGGVPQAVESVEAQAVTVATRANVASGQPIDVVPAQAVQGQPILKDGNLETASTVAQPVSPAPALSTTEPVKQMVSTPRKGLTSVKAAGDATSDAVTASLPKVEMAASGSTGLPAAMQITKPSTVPAVAAVAEQASRVKALDATPLPIRNPTPQSKAAATSESLTVVTAVSKEAGVPNLAPAAQATVLPGDQTGFSASVAVPAIPTNSLPHMQTIASAATGASRAEGVVATGQPGMDSTASLPHTTLSSTPTSLEVGVSSGTHGWLKIRAELNAAGEVNASLTGANTAATEKLRGDLPALNSYLQAEKVSVGVLDVRSTLHTAVASLENGSTFSQTGSGQQGSGHSGQGGAQGTTVSTDAGASGGRAQQQTPQGGDTSPAVAGLGATGVGDDKVLLGRISDAAVYGIHTELGGNEGSPSLGYGAGGGWLNVRA